MKINQLLETAGLTEYEFSGSLANDVYDAALYVPGTSLTKGVLYLQSRHETLKVYHFEKYDFLLLDASVSEEKLLHTLQKIIKEDYHKRLLISRLYNVSSVLDIQQICIEAMGNMVLFLNRNFRPFDASAASSFQLPTPSVMLATLRPSGAPSIVNVSEINGRFLLGEIRDMTETAVSYMLVLENEQTFIPSRDLEYVQLICDTLFGRLHLSDHADRQLSTPGGLIRAVLSGQLSSPHIIREITTMLNWPSPGTDIFYLLTITGPILSRPLSLRNQLRTLLNNKIYIYNQYYIVLLECSWNQEISAASFPGLTLFLEKNNLSAALSYGFSDITNLSNAFEQTLVAISAGSERKNASPDKTTFVRYEDIIFSHFFALARNAGIPLVSFCHPLLERIHRYDEENHSDYLLTLAAYILKGQNLQEAANALYIHKNTMYNRLQKMKEIFVISFDEPSLNLKLHMSILVYAYIGILNIKFLE